jgi:soluble lytic murein transglycosylase
VTAGMLVAVLSFTAPVLSQPRMPGSDAQTQALPSVIGEQDIRLYQRIFEVQEDGDWQTADKLIKRLENDILMGHVLFQRYMHPTKYRSKYNELKDWMASYADLPEADTIYKLALSRRPSNWKMPDRPQQLEPSGVLQVRVSFNRIHIPVKNLSVRDRQLARYRVAEIKSALRRGQTLTAKNLITEDSTERLLSAAQYDEARVGLAKGYFIDGRDDWALDWALPALKRSGKYLPEGHWTAGLVLWRAEKYAEAAVHFEAASDNDDTSGWMSSAAAFWAARANMAAHQPKSVLALLEKAESYPRTFYGLLATRLLGHDLPFKWTAPAFKGNALTELMENPRARRAIALMQIGDSELAESELRDLIQGSERPLLEAVHALVARGNMASLAVKLDTLLYPDGGGYDGAAYPIPDYIPIDGFSVDRALVYALIRQESRFNPNARSWAGARGLMQLMPGTATFVANSTGMRLKERNKLYTPETNLELGQRYIEMLLGEQDVANDLFKLAVAWNGGPGNLRKWNRNTKHLDDPIFFIESIPSYETRTFVERVLTNFWIYRDRLGQHTPSLDAVARGEWPRYEAMGPGDSELAANAPRN